MMPTCNEFAHQFSQTSRLYMTCDNRIFMKGTPASFLRRSEFAVQTSAQI